VDARPGEHGAAPPGAVPKTASVSSNAGTNEPEDLGRQQFRRRERRRQSGSSVRACFSPMTL
jgi:hypothetical protein